MWAGRTFVVAGDMVEEIEFVRVATYLGYGDGGADD